MTITKKINLSVKDEVLQSITDAMGNGFIDVQISDMRGSDAAMVIIKNNNVIFDYHFIKQESVMEIMNLFQELRRKVKSHESRR